MHRDGLGREIKIGDIVIRCATHNTSTQPRIVVGITPMNVRINDNNVVSPDCLVVISEQLHYNGNDVWTNALEAEFSEQLAKGRVDYEKLLLQLERNS